MPHPTSSIATRRPELAGSVREYDLAADRAGFIGTKIFPVLNVAKDSGTFGRIPIEQLLQNRDDARAPGSGYSRGQFTFEPHSFACQEHGAEEPVDDREAAIYSDYFTAEQISTQRAQDVVLRNDEKRVAAKVHDTTVYTPTALAVQLSDHDNADPLPAFEAAIIRVWQKTGLWPNAIQMNRLQYRHFRQCQSVIDRISSNGAGDRALPTDIGATQIAELVDLPMVMIAGGSQNAAYEGLDASISQIWSDNYIWIGRVATTDDIQEPCVGRTFNFTDDGSMEEGTVETYRDESVRSDIVRFRRDTDENRIHPEAGELISNVL